MTDAPDLAAADEQRSHGAFGLVLVGMAIAVWWPAFTLGAYGDVFYDQLLTVWVAATAGMLVVIFQPRTSGRTRWFRVGALAVPSLWLLLYFVGDTYDESDLLAAAVELFGIVVALTGIPFTLWVLVRVLWPNLFTDLSRRARVGVLVTVLGIAIASWLLGVFQASFLTCEDFLIAGDSTPAGCVSEPQG